MLFGYMNSTLKVSVADELMVTFIPNIYSDPESKNGQHLLCRTEFHGQSESHSSVTIARRSDENNALPQAKLLYGMVHTSFLFQTILIRTQVPPMALYHL